MKEKLVLIVKENEGRAGTFLIAQGFNRRHEQIVRLIKKYQDEFEDLNTLKVFKSVYGKGRPIEEYLLTETQFLFLGTLFKNSDIVVKFKHRLIKEFQRTKKLLQAVEKQRLTEPWLMSRDLGKETRLEETEVIKEFVRYAQAQGSKNAEKYYTVITKMTNSLLFTFNDKFINLRNVLTGRQLMTIASAEQIIIKGLREGMKTNTFYKEIYKNIKNNVEAFVELHGRTEVIKQQLLTSEEENSGK